MRSAPRRIAQSNVNPLRKRAAVRILVWEKVARYSHPKRHGDFTLTPFLSASWIRASSM